MVLMGASELLISWLSTRTRRCHAARSSARSVSLTSVTSSSRCGRPPWRNSPARTSQRPLPPGKVAATTRGAASAAAPSALRTVGEPREPERRRGLAQRALGGAAEEALAGAVDEAEAAAVVEGEERGVDLAEHAAEERGALEGAQALLAQRGGEQVGLGEGEAHGVVGAGGAPAHGEVALAQRGEHVGERLQRRSTRSRSTAVPISHAAVAAAATA
jgi:hypothetical protein